MASSNVIVYDFETYWESKTYSLTKMSAVQYIRDSKFYPQCMAVSVNYKSPIIVEHEYIPTVLKKMGLDNPYNILIGHNSSGFDNLILSEYYHIQPKCLLTDTMHLARWTGLSRVSKESLASLAQAMKIGEKGTGTVTSDGKRTKEDFTPEEWESFKEYCKNDVVLTVELVKRLLPLITPEALTFSDITCRMATEPAFYVDTFAVNEYREELAEKEEQAKETLYKSFGLDQEQFLKTLRSAQKFTTLLMQCDCPPPMKISAKKTETFRKRLKELGDPRADDPEVYTVYVPALSKQDIEFTNLLEHPDERVRLLVQMRLDNNTSMPMSRTLALLRAGEGGKPVPILLKCFFAHTSRYGAGNAEGKSDSLNWQNFGKRAENMKPLRRAIVCKKEDRVVACDSSQIEARVNAYASNQTDLLDHFRNKRDPYAEQAASFTSRYTAQEIHDGAKAGDKECKKLRNIGKTLVLSAGYGVSSKKFHATLLRMGMKDVSADEAALYHRAYRQTNSFIVAFWKTCSFVLNDLMNGNFGRFGGPDNKLFEYGPMRLPTGEMCPSVKMPTGYLLRYPNLRVEDDGAMYYDRMTGKTRIYGAALTENLIQCLSFQILIYQAVLMHDAGVKLVCNIHDSFATIVPKAMANITAQNMIECMSVVPHWVEGLPLAAEAEIAEDFTIV